MLGSRRLSEKAVLVAWIAIVMVLTLGTLPAMASPALAVESQSQESPAESTPDEDGLAIFRSLEDLPVWVQATIVSAAASLTGFALIEIGRLARRRWRRRHFGSNPPLIVQGLRPTVSQRLDTLTKPETKRETVVIQEEAVVVEEPVLDEPVAPPGPIPEMEQEVPDRSIGEEVRIASVSEGVSDNNSASAVRMRIYELARELGLESKEVLARAQELGLEVKTASSGVDDEAADHLRLSYAGETSEASGPDAEYQFEIDKPAFEELEEQHAGEEVWSVSVPEGVSVGAFATAIDQDAGPILRELLMSGIPAGIDDIMPTDLIEEIGEMFGYAVKIQSAEAEPADVVEVEPADVVEVEPADVVEVEPADVVESASGTSQEEPVVVEEPALEEPVAAAEQVSEMAPEVQGADTEEGDGHRVVVVDLTKYEEGNPLAPEPNPNGVVELEPALAGVGSEEKSGLFGAVRNAFVRGKAGHVHQFVESPAGKGLVRQICSQCGYVSIGVVSSRSEHS